MVATNSIMLEIGTKAPAFTLPNPRNNSPFRFSHETLHKGCLIAFICNHCPYVIHILDSLTDLCNQWQEKGLQIIFISSNDVDNYPADSPDLMKELAEEKGFDFPYLYDEDQRVAHAYRAACTPDFFLFDVNYLLYYRGQFDESRPGNSIEPNGDDLANAVNRLISGKSAPSTQKPSLGCNLKWKKGNEPYYFVPKE